MTQQEYEQKLDAALEELDWHDPRSKESSAYKGYWLLPRRTRA